MTETPQQNPSDKPSPRRSRDLPLLARHAITLFAAFALAIPLSYVVGQRVYQHLQLSKLDQAEQEAFDQGLAYVYKHAASKPSVAKSATERSTQIDPGRGADLLATTALAFAQAERKPPEQVIEAAGELFTSLPRERAFGLYDALFQLPGMDAAALNQTFLMQLPLGEGAALLQSVERLERRLLWAQDRVPEEKWLAWAIVLSTMQAERTQHQAASLLGEMREFAGDPRVISAFERLAESPHDSVRARALHAAAGYAAITDNPTGYEQIIFALGRDPNPIIARRAWMIVGHLNPFSGTAANWREADPFVAEAMLWAAVKTNPENHAPAVSAIINHDLKREGLLALTPAAGLSLFELQHTLKAGDLISQWGVESPDFVAAWRTILALGPSSDDQEYWYVNLYEAAKGYPSPLWTDEQKERHHETFLSRYLAITYRSNAFYAPEARELTAPEVALAELAAVEGWALAKNNPNPYVAPENVFAKLVSAATGIDRVDLQSLPAAIDLAYTPNADLMALALANDDRDTLDRWLRSDFIPLRKPAIVATGLIDRRPQLITGVTAQLLLGNPELTDDKLQAMTDAQLDELGLRRVDALTALLEAAEAAPPSANRSSEAKLLRLALWMRGDLDDEFTPIAEAMLNDDDLPTSTVLMALLHKQRPIALDYLFGNHFEPRPDLHKRFVQERYWHVFRRFVDTSDLTLWLWGDTEAQAFQLEAMRQWYAVNRWRIEDGWWPETS